MRAVLLILAAVGCAGCMTEAASDVRFLVQWDHLKAGPVQTAWAEPRFLYPRQEQPLQLAANRWFRLSAYGLAEPGLIYNYRLVLSSGETDQRIAQLNVVKIGRAHV